MWLLAFLFPQKLFCIKIVHFNSNLHNTGHLIYLIHLLLPSCISLTAFGL